MSISTTNWTYLIVTAVVVVFAYLPDGAPAHFLLGFALLLARLLILLGTPWVLAWSSYHMFFRSNRVANIVFALLVSVFLIEALYMLRHHERISHAAEAVPVVWAGS